MKYFVMRNFKGTYVQAFFTGVLRTRFRSLQSEKIIKALKTPNYMTFSRKFFGSL